MEMASSSLVLSIPPLKTERKTCQNGETSGKCHDDDDGFFPSSYTPSPSHLNPFEPYNNETFFLSLSLPHQPYGHTPPPNQMSLHRTYTSTDHAHCNATCNVNHDWNTKLREKKGWRGCEG